SEQGSVSAPRRPETQPGRHDQEDPDDDEGDPEPANHEPLARRPFPRRLVLVLLVRCHDGCREAAEDEEHAQHGFNGSLPDTPPSGLGLRQEYLRFRARAKLLAAPPSRFRLEGKPAERSVIHRRRPVVRSCVAVSLLAFVLSLGPVQAADPPDVADLTKKI